MNFHQCSYLPQSVEAFSIGKNPKFLDINVGANCVDANSADPDQIALLNFRGQLFKASLA